MKRCSMSTATCWVKVLLAAGAVEADDQAEADQWLLWAPSRSVMSLMRTPSARAAARRRSREHQEGNDPAGILGIHMVLSFQATGEPQ